MKIRFSPSDAGDFLHLRNGVRNGHRHDAGDTGRSEQQESLGSGGLLAGPLIDDGMLDRERRLHRPRW